MNPAQIPQVLFYEALDLIPCLVLAVIAFPASMRISRHRMVIMSVLLYLAVAFCRLIALSHTQLAAAMSVLWIALYLLFYKVCIRTEITRLFFVLLLILNYGSFTAIFYSYFTYHRMAPASAHPYSFLSSLIYAAALVVSYPAVYYLIKKKVRPLMEYSENRKIWRFLWMIPATFCLAYYYTLYTNDGIIAYSAYLSNVIFACTFNACGLFIIFIALSLVRDSNATIRLKDENYQLNLQFMQYEKLCAQMEDSRRARHDLRQTVRVIQAYLKNQEPALLEDYLRQFLGTLPADTPALYSCDPALSTLLSYYEERAHAHGVEFRICIEYNGSLPMSDPDKVVLFGNLLENALDACIRQASGKKHILLSLTRQGNSITAIVDNSFDGHVDKNGDIYLSSKTGRPGFGIVSAQKIVAKYDGVIRFEYTQTMFYVSCLLFD